jgi:DNA-binding response OmpR family regulator
VKILLVEDSASLRRTLKAGLGHLGFAVDVTGDGGEGLRMALADSYDLIILDLMLPTLDGISLLKALRREKRDTRILILSAKDLPEDRVNGLIEGADDYLTKPFSFDELHARIVALMRRGNLTLHQNRINLGKFSLNMQSKRFFCAEQEIPLTATEYKIVECLFAHQERVVTAEQISEYLVGHYDAVAKNSIEAHLSSIRRKVKAKGGKLPIKNKRGFGYQAAAE